jgi:hypothetical protein
MADAQQMIRVICVFFRNGKKYVKLCWYILPLSYFPLGGDGLLGHTASFPSVWPLTQHSQLAQAQWQERKEGVSKFIKFCLFLVSLLFNMENRKLNLKKYKVQ